MVGLPSKYIGMLCALFVVILALNNYRALALSTQYPEAGTIGAGSMNFQDLSDRFTMLAQKKGGAYAFDVLKVAQLPPETDLHLLGHVVGDVLYVQEGVDGIKECTQDFRNACSHSIVIGALNEFGSGDATIGKIRDACKLAPGGPGAYTMCFHGLGHGVFAYFGYDIPKAVAFCKRLGTPQYGEQEFTQCVGGIIMELIDGGGHDHDQWLAADKKYLDPADPLSPCDRSLIPSEAKSFCYMYLTPHLFEAAGADLGNPDPATFPRAFSYCDTIGEAKLRDACYGSFGKEFVPLAGARDIRKIDNLPDDAYRTAISWCMMAPNDGARSACIGQSLQSVFWGGENDPAAAFRFCSLTSPGSVQDACYRELSHGIETYMSGRKRTELCQKLPAADQGECGQMSDSTGKS